MPTEERAPAKLIICASVSPICEPAPASLKPIATISDSVVARLFPKATIVDPNLSKSV